MLTTRGSSSSGASAVDQAGSEQQAAPSTYECGPHERPYPPGQVRMYRLTYTFALCIRTCPGGWAFSIAHLKGMFRREKATMSYVHEL